MATSNDILERGIDALDAGRAVVDRSAFRCVEVAGGHARRWLEDLITAGVETLKPGGSRRSLLLSPTGRIRADVHVLAFDDRFLLVQDPNQPRPIDELLAPYVLSSDVELKRLEIALVCHPGGHPRDPRPPGSTVAQGPLTVAPSLLGGGFDVLLLPDTADPLPTIGEGRSDAPPPDGLMTGGIQVDEGTVEVWRIRRGIARFPFDVDEESLPAEAGLVEETVDLRKGCFLGQESVAKVRNLGHPPRVVVHLVGHLVEGDPIRRGDPVVCDGAEVGLVTSSAPDPSRGRTALLARVRWEARKGPLVTGSGTPLRLA